MWAVYNVTIRVENRSDLRLNTGITVSSPYPESGNDTRTKEEA